MTELLPPWPLLSAFMAASLLLAVTPGPGVFYIVTRSAVHGRRHGLASVLGVAAGNLANAVAAALGLAALFAVSAAAFTVVKFAGAAYLVYLGVRMLLARPAAAGTEPPAAMPLAQACRDGFVVAALNPKTTLFFAAFLPQFIAVRTDPVLQTLLLGVVFVAIAAVTDSLYAMAAGALAPRLSGGSAGLVGQRAGGGLCIGLGLYAALSGSRNG